MKLTYISSGVVVAIGDKVDIGGVAHTITDIVAPHKCGSTGRVYVHHDKAHFAHDRGYFPSVIGARWVEGAAA